MPTPLIDRLLDPTDNTPLSPTERELLIAALRELATSQTLIARQGLLLESFGSDQRALEAGVRAAVAEASGAAGAPAPDSGFDHARSKQARDELTRRVRDAATLRDLLVAAVTFLRALA